MEESTMKPFLEKGLPILVSMALHLILFVILLLTFVPAEPPPKQETPIVMEIAPLPVEEPLPAPPPPPAPAPAEQPAPAPAPAAETAEEMVEQPPEPEPAPAAATVAEAPQPREEIKPLEPEPEVKPEETPEPPKPAEEPKPEPETKPTPSAIAELIENGAPPPSVEPLPASPAPSETQVPLIDPEIIEKLRQESEQEKERSAQEVAEVLDDLAEVTEKAKSEGVPAGFDSDGVAKGTVRQLDIEQYPKDWQRAFLARYRIKIEIKFVDGRGQSSYLNAVRTDKGTYVNRGGAGNFEVMTLSLEVLRKMAQLESEELRKRKLDPNRTRIAEVVFGLRESAAGQIDLVVTRFRAEAIK